MEPTTMGQVLVTAKLENLDDLVVANRGLLPPDQVRSVEVTDALVDTGATTLALPSRLIQQLGLRFLRERQVRTTNGNVTRRFFGTIRLTIQGRDAPFDVAEVPDDVPVLIGQLPIEALDFVVDLQGRRLIGNPAHNGDFMYDEL